MKLKIAVLFMLSCLSAQAFMVTNTWDVNVRQYRSINIPIRRGESQDLVPVYYAGTNAINLSAFQSALFRYKPQTTNEYPWGFAGKIFNNTVCFNWSSSNCVTNAVVDYEIALISTNQTMLRAFGKIYFDGWDNFNAYRPPASPNIVDWQTITNMNLEAAPFVQDSELFAMGLSLTNFVRERENASTNAVREYIDTLGAGYSNYTRAVSTDVSNQLITVVNSTSNTLRSYDAGIEAALVNTAAMVRAWATNAVKTHDDLGTAAHGGIASAAQGILANQAVPTNRTITVNGNKQPLSDDVNISIAIPDPIPDDLRWIPMTNIWNTVTNMQVSKYLGSAAFADSNIFLVEEVDTLSTVLARGNTANVAVVLSSGSIIMPTNTAMLTIKAGPSGTSDASIQLAGSIAGGGGGSGKVFIRAGTNMNGGSISLFPADTTYGMIMNADGSINFRDSTATNLNLPAYYRASNVSNFISAEVDTLATVMARGVDTGTNILRISASPTRDLTIASNGDPDNDTDTDTNRLTIVASANTAVNPERGAGITIRGNEYTGITGGDLALRAGNSTGALSGKITMQTAGGTTKMNKSGSWDFGGNDISNVVYRGDGQNIFIGSSINDNTNIVVVSGSGAAYCDGSYTWNGEVYDNGSLEIRWFEDAWQLMPDGYGARHYCITSAVPIGAWYSRDEIVYGLLPAPTSTWGATERTAAEVTTKAYAAYPLSNPSNYVTASITNGLGGGGGGGTVTNVFGILTNNIIYYNVTNNTSITVSGAGTSVVNGVYLRTSGGNWTNSNETYIEELGGGAWNIWGPDYYQYYGSSGFDSYAPIGVWSNRSVGGNADSPYPVVSWTFPPATKTGQEISTLAMASATLAQVAVTNNHAAAVTLGTNLTVGGAVTVGGTHIVFSESAAKNIGLERSAYPVTGQTNSVWMGYAALSDSTGSWNSAIGYAALNGASGSGNSAMGYYALYQSFGWYNSAMGYAALSDSPGSQNSAMGYAALNESTGSGNSAVGYRSLYQSPGSWNSAMGYAALNESPGGYNTAVGHTALWQSPGSYNSAIGYAALSQSTGSCNSALGYYAGFQSIGANNLFLGFEAAKSAVLTTYTNAIAIGAGAVPLGNNSMALGNASTLSTRIHGNVGIGTNNPTERLHVNGNVLVESNLTVSGALTVGTNLYIGPQYVGINMASPTVELDIRSGATPYAVGIGRQSHPAGAYYIGNPAGAAAPDMVFCNAAGIERWKLTDGGVMTHSILNPPYALTSASTVTVTKAITSLAPQGELSLLQATNCTILFGSDFAAGDAGTIALAVIPAGFSTTMSASQVPNWGTLAWSSTGTNSVLFRKEAGQTTWAAVGAVTNYLPALVATNTADGALQFPVVTTPPAAAVGRMYYNTASNSFFRCTNAGTWTPF